MTIFGYADYKRFVRERIQSMPSRGRGQFRQIAIALNLNSTVVSQIFKGNRHLTPDQALKLSRFFGLPELEAKYLLNLVYKERADTHQLKAYIEKDLQKIRARSKTITARTIEHNVIKDEIKAQFYSDWIYSAVRMLSALPKYGSIDEFAMYFQLDRAKVARVTEFLLSNGLCVERSGRIEVGPRNTHLDAHSPFIGSHFRNWRLKSMEIQQRLNEKNIFYSAPVTLSHADFEVVREELLAVIAKVMRRVQRSPEEELACINVDWFGF